MDPQFTQLMQAGADLAAHFSEGLVYIGGIAVYLHAINEAKTQDLAETTHDADLYISLADMADLREIEDLTANRRLGKHQLTKRGFEFDIYTERHANLRVPYDETLAYSEVYDVFKVACLEHLLVLKLAAYEDRKGSSKGEKDARDILRISVVMGARNAAIRTNLIAPYLNDEAITLMEQISKGPACASLANGNSKQAKLYRGSLNSMIASIRDADNAIELTLVNTKPLKR